MTKELGDWGEGIACEYLVEKGFNIVLRNWRIKFGEKQFGEIDIIARKKWKPFGDKTIRFVEVKTLKGSSEHFSPEQRVDFKKQNKLKRLCQLWLDENKISQNHPHQVDIIAVSLDYLGQKPVIHHFENVIGN